MPKLAISLRGDRGGVGPIAIVAIMVVFASAVLVLHIGRGGDLRSQAQTAADASALGAVAEIRDRALLSITKGLLPYASYSKDSTDAAAKRYAKDNGATVEKVESGGFFGHSVATTVRGDEPLRGVLDNLRGAQATAKAIATVEFPSCQIVFRTDDDGDSYAVGTRCDGTFVPIGAPTTPFIKLFKLRLVDKLPPNCALPGASGKTVWPVQDITPSSGYGPRGGEFHGGTDYPGGGLGKPIFAYADGVVVRSGPASGFGQWIVIDHLIDGQKVSTVYGHIYPQDLMVHEGDQVKAGQQIAKVGSNGRSTGPHLHFEYWQGGRFGGASQGVDPHPYVKAASPPSGGQAPNPAALAAGSGGAFAGCGPLGPGGPITGNAGDAKLCASAAKAAGFSGDSLVTITAIGMAESSCNPNATNDNGDSIDYGLFQVNDKAHPEYDPQTCLFDPRCNAQAAYKISGGGSNFYPWCTYDAPACGGAGNGSYRKYLPLAEKVVSELGSKES